MGSRTTLPLVTGFQVGESFLEGLEAAEHAKNKYETLFTPSEHQCPQRVPVIGIDSFRSWHHLAFHKVFTLERIEACAKIDEKKTPGPDGIPIAFYTLIGKPVFQILLKILHLLCTEPNFEAVKLMEGIIVMIPKGNPPSPLTFETSLFSTLEGN